LFAEYAASELTRIRRCTSASFSDGRVEVGTWAHPIIPPIAATVVNALAIFVIASSPWVRITPR
jgi:hypothetical protein